MEASSLPSLKNMATKGGNNKDGEPIISVFLNKTLNDNVKDAHK